MINKFITVLLTAAMFLAIFSACEETDFKGLYTPPKPPEIGDKRTYECKGKPGGEAYSWNSVSEYEQTWNGSSWEPVDDPDTEYGDKFYPSSTSCQYTCATCYTWNYSECVSNPNCVTRTYYCQPKPEGEEYEWNTVSEYKQESTDQGASYYPSDDPSTEYNDSPSTTSCQFKCAQGFIWNGSICTKAATGSRTYECPDPLPDTNGAYVWNSVQSYNQETYDDGVTWNPPDDPETEYNEEGSVTSCRFKCNTGYSWNGSECVYVNWESAVGYQWLKAPNGMTYEDANTFCSNNGGYIPAIDQLKQLIQNCSQTVYGGTCTATNSCVSWSSCRNADCDGCTMQSSGYYSVFGDESWFWSSTQLSDQEAAAYTINFDTGAINMSVINSTYTGNVRCIK
ncbi:MAG TPA: hypothetical protein PLW78_01550 [bacterium]|jgi:hypothetical protein|nr:hypothetical protein [bacterium]HQN73026.1 hypothetical protein [bacterium]HRQ68961.1 hypothetical protein [bacterium]